MVVMRVGKAEGEATIMGSPPPHCNPRGGESPPLFLFSNGKHMPSIRDPESQVAFDAGEDAYFSGFARRDNPHAARYPNPNPNTKLAVAWSNGWGAAKKEDETDKQRVLDNVPKP
jgi:hypothetical protein